MSREQQKELVTKVNSYIITSREKTLKGGKFQAENLGWGDIMERSRRPNRDHAEQAGQQSTQNHSHRDVTQVYANDLQPFALLGNFQAILGPAKKPCWLSDFTSPRSRKRNA